MGSSHRWCIRGVPCAFQAIRVLYQGHCLGGLLTWDASSPLCVGDVPVLDSATSSAQ